MKRFGIIKGSIVFLALLGICLPYPVLAAPPAQKDNTLPDVALLDGGVLVGQVVDTQGAPQANVPISLWEGQQELAVGKTDAAGYFSFRGLRGGVYQLTAADGVSMCRVWAPGTAPPAAQQGALVVRGVDMVRGQWCGFPRLRCMLTNPWVIAGLVATAVAVPVAIHNARDHGPVSP